MLSFCFQFPFKTTLLFHNCLHFGLSIFFLVVNFPSIIKHFLYSIPAFCSLCVFLSCLSSLSTLFVFPLFLFFLCVSSSLLIPALCSHCVSLCALSFRSPCNSSLSLFPLCSPWYNSCSPCVSSSPPRCHTIVPCESLLDGVMGAEARYEVGSQRPARP